MGGPSFNLRVDKEVNSKGDAELLKKHLCLSHSHTLFLSFTINDTFTLSIAFPESRELKKKEKKAAEAPFPTPFRASASITFDAQVLAMAETTLHNVPIVIDNGSGTIRAGFAGEEIPSCYFPSFVGRPKHPRVMAGGLEGDVFIGQRAQELRGLLKIRYPLEHGIVTDWDDMEKIWHYVYENELKTLPEEHPVLLTEPPLNPRKNRDIAAQIMFETFNVPALYLSIQAILSLYASGRTTGVVLDSGDGVSHAVPVFEGFAIPNSIRRIDVAGRDVTEQLQLLLRKNGTVMHTSAEKEVVRMIKEKACYVSLDPKREEKDWMTTYRKTENNAVDYFLPDGHKIKVSEVSSPLDLQRSLSKSWRRGQTYTLPTH